jgi:hypothetical protein
MPHKPPHLRRLGFTLTELLAVVAATAALLTCATCLARASLLRDLTADDAARLGEVHRGMLRAAADRGSTHLPLPGLIRRKQIAGALPNGASGFVPGLSPEDLAQNNTANLFSSTIAGQFIHPNELVSPVESNPVVKVKQNYNHNAYNPTASNPTFWDPTFLANIFRLNDGQSTSVCHTSYAHLAIHGERKRLRWRSSAGSMQPLLGNRGTFKGATSGNNYTKSYSLLFHPPLDQWDGNLAFGDNHVSLEHSFSPQGTTHQCGSFGETPDNIFAWQDFSTCSSGSSTGGDTWMCISIGAPNSTTYAEAPEKLTDGTNPT